MCLLSLSKANTANVAQQVVTAAKCPLRAEDETAAVRDCKPPTLAARARLVLFHRTKRPSAWAWRHKSSPFDLEMSRQSCSSCKVAVPWWWAGWPDVASMFWMLWVCPSVGRLVRVAGGGCGRVVV